MTNTFYFTFNTDADKNRMLNIKNAKTEVSKADFDIYADKIMDSGVLNANGVNLTGVRKAELVTQTRERCV